MRKKFAVILLIFVFILTGCSNLCKVDGCENERAAGSNFCVEHTCTVDGCSDKKDVSSDTGYCENHICPIEGCTKVKEKKLAYCENHFCSVENCFQVRVSENYCEEHRCIIEGCPELKPEDSDICQIHQEEKETNRKKALSKLKFTTDEFQEVTWYEPQCTPEYINQNAFYIYMGENPNSNHRWLRWKAVYSGDNWIFFDKIIINIDGENHQKVFNYFDVKRDNARGGVWEYIDVLLEDEDIELFRKIANSDKTMIRFYGDKHQYDREITQNEKYGILDILNAYE